MRNLGRKVNRKMDCGKEGNRDAGMLQAAGSRPYGERRWMGMEGIRKGTSRAPSPTRGCEPGGKRVSAARGGRLQDLRRLGRQSAARQRRIITAGNGRLVRNEGMIATGNHFRFRIRSALQHAPTPTEMGYPERDVEGAVPYDKTNLLR